MKVANVVLVFALLALLGGVASQDTPTTKDGWGARYETNFNAMLSDGVLSSNNIDEWKAASFCGDFHRALIDKSRSRPRFGTRPQDGPAWTAWEEFWVNARSEHAEKVKAFFTWVPKHPKRCLADMLAYSKWTKHKEVFTELFDGEEIEHEDGRIGEWLDAAVKFTTGELGNHWMNHGFNAVSGAENFVHSWSRNKDHTEAVLRFFSDLHVSKTRHHQVMHDFVREGDENGVRGKYSGRLFAGMNKWVNGLEERRGFTATFMAKRPMSMCEIISRTESANWKPVAETLAEMHPENIEAMIKDYGVERWKGKMFRELVNAAAKNDLKGVQGMSYLMTGAVQAAKRIGKAVCPLLRGFEPFLKFYGKAINIILGLATELLQEHGAYQCTKVREAIEEANEGADEDERVELPNCVEIWSAIQANDNVDCSSLEGESTDIDLSKHKEDVEDAGDDEDTNSNLDPLSLNNNKR